MCRSPQMCAVPRHVYLDSYSIWAHTIKSIQICVHVSLQSIYTCAVSRHIYLDARGIWAHTIESIQTYVYVSLPRVYPDMFSVQAHISGRMQYLGTYSLSRPVCVSFLKTYVCVFIFGRTLLQITFHLLQISCVVHFSSIIDLLCSSLFKNMSRDQNVSIQINMMVSLFLAGLFCRSLFIFQRSILQVSFHVYCSLLKSISMYIFVYIGLF